MTQFEAFSLLREIGKKPVLAQIGGFRPEEARMSWFGGHFYIDKEAGWPHDKDGPMIPVLQAYVPEIPGGIDGVGEASLIQLFLNRKQLPIYPVKNGEGWLLIEHQSVEELKLMETPEEARGLREFQIRWHKADSDDYPCWEEAWDYVDLTEVNEDEDASDQFFDEFDSYPQTKIGGYASYIQSPVSLEDCQFIMQIGSEEKPRFMVGDNGTIYLFRSRSTGEWHMHWDCY
ncbi:DUF1963 domain-containing protein [Niallia circulans]|uniref:DUF1963 domain-containing protein n=1 Tax=Niallia circulans TaxID=1397 RepID=UPI0026F012EC|nr:DUF1963 domain-containing protein [Niallia circulans]